MKHRVFCSSCDCEEYDCQYNLINSDPDDGICALSDMAGRDGCLIVEEQSDDSLLNVSTLEV